MFAKTLAPRLTLIAVSYTISVICTLFYLILLPFRLLQRIRSPPASPPPAKVSIITREPSAPHTTPRDTVFLIHGFPDSPAMFDAQVAVLTANGYRCLLAALPGSGGEPVGTAMEPNAVAELVRDALRKVHAGRVTVIAHDWGAFFALYLIKKYPDQFRRAVFLDIGYMGKVEPSVLAPILAYQTMLSIMYLLGHPAGTIGLKAFLVYAKYNVRPLKEVTTDMCHLYLGMMKTIAKSGLKPKPPGARDNSKHIPHLFAYGAEKPFMFHSDDWNEFVRSTPEGQVVAMPCGHWVNKEQPEETNLLLTQWLEKTENIKVATRCETESVSEKATES